MRNKKIARNLQLKWVGISTLTIYLWFIWNSVLKEILRSLNEWTTQMIRKCNINLKNIQLSERYYNVPMKKLWLSIRISTILCIAENNWLISDLWISRMIRKHFYYELGIPKQLYMYREYLHSNLSFKFNFND